MLVKCLSLASKMQDEKFQTIDQTALWLQS